MAATAGLVRAFDRGWSGDATPDTGSMTTSSGAPAVTLPANSYPGQGAPLASVGSWSYVLAKPALPEAAAYLLARAIHRAESAFAARLEQARETTMANTLAAAPRRELVHPGVARYLAEAGLR